MRRVCVYLVLKQKLISTDIIKSRNTLEERKNTASKSCQFFCLSRKKKLYYILNFDKYVKLIYIYNIHIF